MKTFAALLILSTSAVPQEPPRPPDRPPQEGDRAVELERKIRAIRQLMVGAREEEKDRLTAELRTLEEEQRRLRPEPPGPGRPPQDRERAAELQARINELKTALESIPKESPDRPQKENELRRMEDEVRRLRRPPQVPEPPTPPAGRSLGPPAGEGPPFPPGAERRRPVSNPEEIRSWLKEHEPETYQRLMALQERGQRPEVLEMLAAAEGRMVAMNDMKTRDPRGYERIVAIRKLEQETLELGEKARQVPPEEREQASAPLKEKLSRLFDLREEARARELEELRRRVGELEKALAGRKANKERILENRRRVLLGERPADEW